MSRPLFRPTLHQSAFLAAVTLCALGYGFYLRYRLIEQPSIGIACQDGIADWQCATRRSAIALFTPSVFGLVALGASALNLLRPSVMLCAIALTAAGLGIVLYNIALSAFAVALLILSLARPAPEPD